jgi:hypothetical protein
LDLYFIRYNKDKIFPSLTLNPYKFKRVEPKKKSRYGKYRGKDFLQNNEGDFFENNFLFA